ncbi:MAG TPA: hypothetical protein VKI61_04990 [Chitinophagaceae bacterium]|jgi:hypothetical protein|nr:hypothetical protein [Chitinophagaceae bacterium]
MKRLRHFKTVYKNDIIKITGTNPTYTVEWPDGKTIIIERFADGWYMPKSLEQHWTDHDIAALGALIGQRTKPK